MNNDWHAFIKDRIEANLKHGKGDEMLALLGDSRLSRSEALMNSSSLMARFYAEGLRVGDRIIITSVNEEKVILHVIAGLRAGICFVIGDPLATARELEDMITVCRPAAVFADADRLDQLKEIKPIVRSFDIDKPVEDIEEPKDIPDPANAEVALMIFTSGTTSAAKAVELTYENLMAQMEIFAEAYAFEPDIRVLNLLPLHHTDGLTRGPLSALWFNGTLLRPFSFAVQTIPRLLNAVSELQASHFVAVPAILSMIERLGKENRKAFQAPGFLFVICSADLLEEKLWTRFEETFGVSVVNAYGLSEVVCDALFAGPDNAERIPGTIGRPVGLLANVLDAEGNCAAVGEIGELVLSGPTVMKGYFGAPDLTSKVLREGKLFTGDLVRKRADDLFEFVGRRKTEIVSSGVTLIPEGVTSILNQMTGIVEAFSFGVPDPVRGQRLVAAVVVSTSIDVRLEDIWAFCRENLSPERLPREIHILDTLPRNATGKVLIDVIASLTGNRSAPEPSQSHDIYEIVADCLNLPKDTLNSDSSPFNTPGWDSLAHMAIISEIEERHDIIFSAQDIAEFGSLEDAETIVQRLVG